MEYNKMVKEGHLEKYPKKEIGKAFENFFSSTEWTSFKSSDGERIVEFTGKCMYMDEKVTARIQFTIEDDTFEVTYLAFNDVPQTKIMLWALMEKVFE